MASKRKSFADKARELSEGVRSELKAEMRKRNYRQVDLERTLGRSHGYFSHLFAGRLTLTMEGILEVLLAIGADPADFFANALASEEKGPPTAQEIERTVLRALKRYGYGPGGKKSPEKENGET